MYKKTLTYTDYNGVERTEDFHFNLTKAELIEYQVAFGGDTQTVLKGIVESQDVKEIYRHFKELITRSYGVKSTDGKRFIKNQEVKDSFVESEAFSTYIMMIIQDGSEGTAFVNGIMPFTEAELLEAAKAVEESNKVVGVEQHANAQVTN